MIKFPKVHIAKSVVNRILNVADEVYSDRQPATARQSASIPPNVPDVAAEGAQLEQALSQPTPALPGLNQAPDAGATMQGAPLLSTVLKQQ